MDYIIALYKIETTVLQFDLELPNGRKWNKQSSNFTTRHFDTFDHRRKCTSSKYAKWVKDCLKML
jgi:hypothetical protein